MAGFVDRVDSFQRRHPVMGFPVAVFYKYLDDQGAYLAAMITYYAFVAIFPLMLIASSVLGFLLQGNLELRETLLDSALGNFPIVGTQLGKPEGLQGSAGAVVIGSLAALYGVLGLAAAAQHALNVAWAVPRNSRFNPFVGRFRGFVSFVFAGFVLILTTSVSIALSNLGSAAADDRRVGAAAGQRPRSGAARGRPGPDDAPHHRAATVVRHLPARCGRDRGACGRACSTSEASTSTA